MENVIILFSRFYFGHNIESDVLIEEITYTNIYTTVYLNFTYE